MILDTHHVIRISKSWDISFNFLVMYAVYVWHSSRRRLNFDPKNWMLCYLLLKWHSGSSIFIVLAASFNVMMAPLCNCLCMKIFSHRNWSDKQEIFAWNDEPNCKLLWPPLLPILLLELLSPPGTCRASLKNF